MATAPDPTKLARAEAREAMDSVDKTLRINGNEYRISPSMLNGRRDAVIFKALGISGMDCLAMLARGEVTLFVLAALVWLARDDAGDQVTIEEVLEDTNLEGVVEMIDNDDEETTRPPA
jgi:hypothetical protein